MTPYIKQTKTLISEISNQKHLDRADFSVVKGEEWHEGDGLGGENYIEFMMTSTRMIIQSKILGGNVCQVKEVVNQALKHKPEKKTETKEDGHGPKKY